MKKKKKTIGRKDKACLPELELEDLAIKIDTGAYTSAIHCHKIKTIIKGDKEVLVFTLLDPSHPQYNNKELSTENYREKLIKNSFGLSERRFVINTDIELFGRIYPIEFSLSARGEMRFPILIGRKFLMGKFIVNPSKYDLSFKEKKNKTK